jgi:hypothetical protein
MCEQGGAASDGHDLTLAAAVIFSPKNVAEAEDNMQLLGT